ncbi:MAG: NIPSNAP family protein [Sinobacteraceae bacterium]|nr:NIPSNAP family protein [Nevskiaceae bacterium]
MNLSRRGFVAAAAGSVLGARLPQAPAVTPSGADPALRVIELRQYTLHQGRRDTLIGMFEEHFIEPQNVLGAHIVGTFRDLDDPDRFVWIRGFADMQVRQRSLEAFYGGPVWQAHRQAANLTMLDSDNVLMLRPVSPAQGFAAAGNTAQDSHHIIGARIHYLGPADAPQFASYFNQVLLPRFAAMGVRPLAQLISHEAANNFRLPIREHETVFVWLARWTSLAEEEDWARRWSAVSGWRDEAPESLLPAFMRKPERLRLAPTALSALR